MMEINSNSRKHSSMQTNHSCGCNTPPGHQFLTEKSKEWLNLLKLREYALFSNPFSFPKCDILEKSKYLHHIHNLQFNEKSSAIRANHWEWPELPEQSFLLNLNQLWCHPDVCWLSDTQQIYLTTGNPHFFFQGSKLKDYLPPLVTRRGNTFFKTQGSCNQFSHKNY